VLYFALMSTSDLANETLTLRVRRSSGIEERSVCCQDCWEILYTPDLSLPGLGLNPEREGGV
jgi:hypothetical protein